jgi:virginiamycin B lyase
LKAFIICSLLVFALIFYIKPIEVLAIPSDQNIAMTKSWALPLPGDRNSSFPITSSFSGNDIYFADSSSNSIGSLDVNTNTITKWNIPTANSLPTSVKFDSTTGNVYFIESNANTIGRLTPVSSEFTEWKLQEKPSTIEIDSAGSVHYIDESGSKIVRMD